MKFLELLAVTRDNQQIVIINTEEEIKEQRSCLFLWGFSIYLDKNVIRIKSENDLMYVMLKI